MFVTRNGTPGGIAVAKRYSLTLLGGLLLGVAAPAGAAPDVVYGIAHLTAQLRGGELDGWRIDFSFVAHRTSGMTITPPERSAIELDTWDPVPPDNARFFLDRSFATREAMLADFPPGDYVLEVADNGATVTLTLETDVLDGFMVITLPTHGSKGVDPSPIIERSNTCGNCFVEWLHLQGVGENNWHVFQTAEREDLFPVHYTLDDFEGYPTVTVLPEGEYLLEAAARTSEYSRPTFSIGGDRFDFERHASARDRSVFEVPEADSGLSAAAALAGLWSLRRRAVDRGRRYSGSLAKDAPTAAT